MSTTVKNFYGRKKELSILESKIKLQRSNLVIIRGRRRIGKTTLVKYFAQKYSFWQFEGLAPTIKTSKQNQIDNFMLQLSLQSNASKMMLEDWIEVFKVFSGYISNKKTVILFDEISWMGSKDPDFLSKIKFAWDNFFANKKNVLLIICGSASSWIEKNLISSTGFVGRISQIITLEGLDISYVRTFWRNKDISSYEILKILCITGTIPKYLEEIDPKLTAEENISNLCFQKGGFLVEEFNRIFSDLFLRNSDVYKKIVISLANSSKTLSQISKDINFSRSGRLNDYLKELVLSGFVEHNSSWSIKSKKYLKNKTYRLSDNYTRFYIKNIEPRLQSINNGEYKFRGLPYLPNWLNILGLQFENLVLSNKLKILDLLGIELDNVICQGTYFQGKNNSQSSCQIDYMIQDRFNTLYVCEIKFSTGTIGIGVINDLKKKLVKLKSSKLFSHRPVLIYVGNISEKLKYSEYFFKIINFAELI